MSTWKINGNDDDDDDEIGILSSPELKRCSGIIGVMYNNKNIHRSLHNEIKQPSNINLIRQDTKTITYETYSISYRQNVGHNAGAT